MYSFWFENNNIAFKNGLKGRMLWIKGKLILMICKTNNETRMICSNFKIYQRYQNERKGLLLKRNLMETKKTTFPWRAIFANPRLRRNGRKHLEGNEKTLWKRQHQKFYRTYNLRRQITSSNTIPFWLFEMNHRCFCQCWQSVFGTDNWLRKVKMFFFA